MSPKKNAVDAGFRRLREITGREWLALAAFPAIIVAVCLAPLWLG